MELRLTISMADVRREVATITGYIGGKRKGLVPGTENQLAVGVDYEHVATEPENAELLDIWRDEARAHLCNRMRSRLHSEELSPDGLYTIVMEPWEGYKDVMNGALRRYLQSFFVYYILQGWFETIGLGDDAEQHAAEAAVALDELDRSAQPKITTRDNYPW